MRPIQHLFRNMMMKTRLSKATAAVMVGALAGLSAPARAIDDTEIFFNPTSVSGTTNKPNVLFILDNSGSMSDCFSGSGWGCKTRMDALKEAMTDLLNSDDVYNGINAGIMRFDGDDSDSEYIPVFYPIKPLTDNASTVDSGSTYGSGTKVRDRLLKIVNDMSPRGGTPIVGALYEAARYLTGSTVGFTDDGTGYYGVPHKAAVTGGSYQKCTSSWSWWSGWTTTCTSTCDSGTTGSSRCTTTGTPEPTYISPLSADRGTPFTQATKPQCAQADYVVLVTDGLPTSSTSSLRTKAQTLTGQSSCVTGSGGTDGKCGPELAAFMHGTYNSGDIRSGQTGNQWVITHTIALALSDTNGKNYLQEIATAGGGNAYTANQPDELADALSQIIAGAISRSAATGVPAVSLNVFNPLYTRNDVYLSVFDPTNRQRWAGNVKKYKFCDVDDNPATPAVEGCTTEGGSTVTFGTYLSRGSTSSTYVKATDSSGDFLITSKDLWNTTSTPDGSKVRAGGAGAVLDATTKSTRKLYTFTGSYSSNRLPATSSSSNPDLSQNINLLNTRSSYTCSSSSATDNCNITPALFGISGGLTAANVTSMNNIIKWIRDPGLDVNDGNGNSSTTDYYDSVDDDNDGADDDPLWPFEDPMHASPVAWEYGGSSSSPITKIFVPTNNGGIRMLNADTGAEEWMFIPQELLARQSALMDTSAILPAGARNFGLDMTPVIWVRDDNDNDATNGVFPNGQIEPTYGDYVHLVLGERDGGRAYYALDVTPSGNVTTSSSSATINPKLLWKIEGGVTSGFTNLQNTWSMPTRGRVRVSATGGIKNVLIFGGGNPVGASSTTSPGGFNYRYGTNIGSESAGNIVYIVDADTGELLYSIGGAGTTATMKTAADGTGMNYPIPSAITALDTSGDGITDRLYFGDLGGNVWRVDLYNDGTSSNSLTAAVDKLADLAPTVAGPPATGKPATSVTTRQVLNANSRTFYYRPAVVQVNRPDYGGRFDMVLLASGQRENPRNGQDNSTTGNATVINSIYAIMDYKIKPTDKASDSDFPIRKSGTSGTPLLVGDLLDLTSNGYQMTKNATTGKLELTSTQKTALKTAYQTKTGWYITLSDTGEKGVSTVSVTNDIVVFNTYTPAATSSSANSCNLPNPGSGRIYAIDLFTGSAVFSNFNTSDGGGSNPTTSDRANLGVGMPVEGSNLGSTSAGLILLTNHGGGDPDGINGSGGSGNGTTDTDGMGSGSASINPLKGLPRGRIYWYER
ncbi:MAG: PilC/PilY family type IV pilus protein [Gammaproteobacteria bacterium]